MTYRVAKNTAVDFSDRYSEANVNELGCYYIPYCSLIENGDITGVQIYQASQNIKATALWDFSSGTTEQWTAGAGWAFLTPQNLFEGTATNSSITYSSIIEPSGVYRVSYDISSYTAGDITPQLGTKGGTAVGANGTFSEIIFTQDTTVGDLNFNGNNNFSGRINNIRLELLYYMSAFDVSASGYTTGSFTLTGGAMNHVNAAGVTPLTQDLLSAGQTYKVTVEVQNHTFGTIEISGGTQVFGTIAENVNGTFTVYGVAQAAALNFTPTDDLAADIISIKVEKLYTGSKMGICDTDCNFIEFLDPTEYLSQVNDALAIQVDWALHTLDESLCYKLCYFDAETAGVLEKSILNGTFDDSSYWVLPAGVTIGSGTINAGATTVASAHNVSDSLVVGQKYLVEFEITFILGAAEVVVELGTNQSAIYNTTGIKSFELECQTDNEFSFNFNISAASSMAIDNLSVTAVIDETTTPTVCSNCFKFDPCYNIYFTWNNEYPNLEPARDAFDFRYKDYPTYINSFRMHGKLQNPTYPTEITYDTNDSRDFTVSVADVKSSQTLAGSKIPNWIIQAIAMGVVHNNFKINDTKYLNLGGDIKRTDLNCLMGNFEIELTESGNKNVNECC